MFWVNPPFHRAKQFIQAANRHAQAGDSVLLMLQEWPDRPWYGQAQQLFTKVHTFQAGTMLFDRHNMGSGPEHRYCAPYLGPVSLYAKLQAGNEVQLSEKLKGAFPTPMHQTYALRE